MKEKKLGIECDFRLREGGPTRRERLWAHWEISLAPIYYNPQETTAEELLHDWADRASESFPNGIVPISWFVDGENFKVEFLPGTMQIPEGHRDFLTYYTHPRRTDTGDRLRWIDLPVPDGDCNHEMASKGGFIQEATGWKPSIFQSFVLLDHLVGFQRTDEVRGLKEVSVFRGDFSEALR